MPTFVITLRSKDDVDSIRTLRAALKLLLRRFGLHAIKVEEVKSQALSPWLHRRPPKKEAVDHRYRRPEKPRRSAAC